MFDVFRFFWKLTGSGAVFFRVFCVWSIGVVDWVFRSGEVSRSGE